jgi:hypothetical protein
LSNLSSFLTSDISKLHCVAEEVGVLPKPAIEREVPKFRRVAGPIFAERDHARSTQNKRPRRPNPEPWIMLCCIAACRMAFALAPAKQIAVGHFMSLRLVPFGARC